MLTATRVTARDVASAPEPRKPLGALFRRRSPLSSPVLKPVPWSPHNLPELTRGATQCIPLSPAARDADWVPGLGRSLEEGMASHSSVLAWSIPWPEEPARQQPVGPQTARHAWALSLHPANCLCPAGLEQVGARACGGPDGKPLMSGCVFAM